MHAFKGPAVFTIELTTKKHKESLSACFTSWQKCLLYILYIYIYITDWLEVAHDTQSGIGNEILRLETRFSDWKQELSISIRKITKFQSS